MSGYKEAVLRVRAKHFLKAIQEHGGVQKAALAIGVSRRTMSRVIRKAQETGAIRV